MQLQGVSIEPTGLAIPAQRSNWTELQSWPELSSSITESSRTNIATKVVRCMGKYLRILGSTNLDV
jgi:hypothetical protein